MQMKREEQNERYTVFECEMRGGFVLPINSRLIQGIVWARGWSYLSVTIGGPL